MQVWQCLVEDIGKRVSARRPNGDGEDAAPMAGTNSDQQDAAAVTPPGTSLDLPSAWPTGREDSAASLRTDSAEVVRSPAHQEWPAI
jgi:hypothetical protein